MPGWDREPRVERRAPGREGEMVTSTATVGCQGKAMVLVAQFRVGGGCWKMLRAEGKMDWGGVVPAAMNFHTLSKLQLEPSLLLPPPHISHKKEGN